MNQWRALKARFRQMLCDHDWRIAGQHDYGSFPQVFYDDGTRRRVTCETCRICGKDRYMEKMIQLVDR